MSASIGCIATLEWTRARARPRLFLFNIVIPLLLALPLSLGSAPPQHEALVFTLLFVLFGTFGSAIPALRDGEHGLMRRMALTALQPRLVLLERAFAGAALDLVQLLPATVLITLGASAAIGPWTRLVLVLAATLLLVNLFGLWIAALARSIAEGALFSAVCSLLLLHASGVFRSPAPGSMAARMEAISPFRALHESVLAVPLDGPAAAGAPALAISIMVAVLITSFSARRLLRALAQTDSR